jgi:predicted metal-dependent phosphoesterase TrpH
VIDLHTHSTASDGAFTPGELIRKAAEEGLAAIALTDHDCLDGWMRQPRRPDWPASVSFQGWKSR